MNHRTFLNHVRKQGLKYLVSHHYKHYSVYKDLRNSSNHGNYVDIPFERIESTSAKEVQLLIQEINLQLLFTT